MKLKRKEWFYNLVRLSSMIPLHSLHNIECGGSEHIPEEGPALLLPKHQCWQDILLEAYFLKSYCNRKGNWVMKSTLPGFLGLEALGGIGVKRPRDIRKMKYMKEIREIGENGNIGYNDKIRKKIREKIRNKILEAKEFNKKAGCYINYLYRNGEIVVVHPEGTRIKGDMGTLRIELIVAARDFEKENNVKIPAIPLGIEYDWEKRKVYLRAGKPQDLKNPNLVSIIEKEIKSLSGL